MTGAAGPPSLASLPAAPAHLSERSRELWDELVSDELLQPWSPEGLEILRLTLRALDRADQAAEVLDREGLTIAGARGGTIANPAAAIERTSRAAVLAGFAQLGIGGDDRTDKQDRNGKGQFS